MSRGTPGYVYLKLVDRHRFATFMGLTTRQFTSRYCSKTDGHFDLNQPEKDCEFLKDKRCTVYEARPSQCRKWPFWPENMNAKTWHEEIASFCAGIGKGNIRTAQEIAEILKVSQKNDG